MFLFEMAKKLSALPAVSGRECLAHKELEEHLGDLFDEIRFTPTGSVIAVKRCGKSNAKKILLDAHLDEVGFLVKDVCEGGFLKVVNVGGIDTGILSAAEVLIYGSETIPGVFISKPPHLQEPNESENKPKLADLSVDTGLSLDKLKEIAPIGTPIAFRSEVERLKGDRICGKSFDDRICMLTIMRAVELLSNNDIDFDIYALFASGEETGYIGASTGLFEVNPDLAIALDVCNAYVEGADEIFKARKLGGGSVISYSATTCRDITERIIKTAKDNSLPYQLIAEPSATGTDAHIQQITRAGIPGALISLPLYHMHTYNEIIDLNDVENTAKLLAEFIKSESKEA